MNKRDARRNLIVAGLLFGGVGLMTFAYITYIQYFVGLPR